MVLAVALLAQSWPASALDVPALRTGATVFVTVCVQALPFLVIGGLTAAVLNVVVPRSWLDTLVTGSCSASW